MLAYKFRLTQNTESTLRNMRWAAHFYLSGDKNRRKTKYYVKSRLCPPQIEDMIEFERDVAKMLEKVESRHYTNPFLEQLKADTIRIRNSNNAFISADKTRNYYETAPAECKKITTDSVKKVV